MLNKVMLIGNLGADPETRYMQDQTCVCNLRIATTERWKDRATGQQQERTEWHRVELWGRLGEIAAQYLRKGSRVYIEGSIRTDKWTDQSGQDRYITKVRASEMKMLDRRNEGPGGMPPQQGGYQQQDQSGFPAYGGSPAASQKPASDPFADSPDFAQVSKDDDLPF